MRDHHDWANGIRDAVVKGDLKTARRFGSELAEHTQQPRLVDLELPHLVAMRSAAQASASATKLDPAGAALGRLAATCGACHRALSVTPRFHLVPRPTGNPDPKSRMALHRWAADRLWEGLGPFDASWQQGTQALQGSSLCALSDSARPAAAGADKRSAPPPPPPPSPAAHDLRVRLDELVHEAPRLENPEKRGDWYGRFITTCARCHEAGCDVAPLGKPAQPK
ncbi:MAG: hypothetical protein V3V08_00010 [Nannocystaceae bacterium]